MAVYDNGWHDPQEEGGRRAAAQTFTMPGTTFTVDTAERWAETKATASESIHSKRRGSANADHHRRTWVGLG